MSDIDRVKTRVRSFAKLEPGWLDGFGVPPSAGAVEAACRLLEELHNISGLTCLSAPTEHGAVSLEYERNHRWAFATVYSEWVDLVVDPDGSAGTGNVEQYFYPTTVEGLAAVAAATGFWA